jgi:hypothetical protein
VGLDALAGFTVDARQQSTAAAVSWGTVLRSCAQQAVVANGVVTVSLPKPVLVLLGFPLKLFDVGVHPRPKTNKPAPACSY